jgi:CMP-N-acetylneuraminic acid synthetase
MLIALIPARSGSKGLKDKNIANVGDMPLITHSILHAQGCDRVIVFTDSDRYAGIAKEWGAEAIMRDEFSCTDTASTADVLTDFYNKVDVCDNDLIAYLRPTFLFRPNVKEVASCIGDFDSVRVVCDTESRIYTEPELIDFQEVNRQQAGQKYRIFNTDIYRGNETDLGHPYLYKGLKLHSFDIDDAEDLIIARGLYEGLRC